MHDSLRGVQKAAINEGYTGVQRILVVTCGSSGFSQYYPEILRSEGLNSFATLDLASLSTADLTPYYLILLGQCSASSTQITTLTNWVNNGGRLLAMRPVAGLASLLGITRRTTSPTTLSQGYFRVDTRTPPGVGVANETLQFHGTADLYSASGSTTLATLYNTANSSAARPAAGLRNTGTKGGRAGYFAFDVATSIVQTRQGNPQWAHMDNDEYDKGTIPIRSEDLFIDPSKPATWNDFSKIAIPQADELQHFLANMISFMLADKLPLPRIAFLPNALPAAIIMTGDDHGSDSMPQWNMPGISAERFDYYMAQSRPGCSVENWECIRATTYIQMAPGYPSIYPTFDRSRWTTYSQAGFEISLHPVFSCGAMPASGVLDCLRNHLVGLPAGSYTGQVIEFNTWAYGIPDSAPTTARIHGPEWADYDSPAIAMSESGIRLDTSFLYWPPIWQTKGTNGNPIPMYETKTHPGYFTGSVLPMRYAKSTGQPIDIFQATTYISDMSAQTYPDTAIALLAGVFSRARYGGVITALAHNDSGPGEPPINYTTPTERTQAAVGIVQAAQLHRVPVVSAKQMLTWLDARNQSYFSGLSLASGALSFTFTKNTSARNLRIMLPTTMTTGALQSVSGPSGAVAYTVDTYKGVDYAAFAGENGNYTAQYASAVGDSTVSDFNGGTLGTGAAVTQLSDGEVSLYGWSENQDFSGSSLPSSWTSVSLATGSVLTVDSGAVTLDATRVGSEAWLNVGQSMEFVATFGTDFFQHCGLGQTFKEPYWAIFSTNNEDSALWARTANGGQMADTKLVGHWLGSPHLFRIDWLSTGVDYWIDGTRVAHHSFAPTTVKLRMLAADESLGQSILTIDSARTRGLTGTVPDESEFSGIALPWNWTSAATDGNGKYLVGAGAVNLDGARVGSEQWSNSDRTMEFVATFGAGLWQHGGFGADYVNPPWAIFSTSSDGTTLHARTNNGSQAEMDTVLPGTWLNAAHRYRIDCTGTKVSYWIDGAQVAVHPLAMSSVWVRPLFEDHLTGGATLTVDRVRAAAYPASDLVEWDFNGNALPPQWTSGTYGAGAGSAWVNGGVLTADGAFAGSTDAKGPGRVIELVATFTSGAPFQHAGFARDFSAGPWAIFSTTTGSELFVRTFDGVQALTTSLGTGFLGAAHFFRIEWTASTITYSVDGKPVAYHNLAIATPMRALVGDYNAGGATLIVPWMRTSSSSVSPVQGFVSRVLNAGKSVKWLSAQLDEIHYADATLRIEARTGNTATYDSTWSGWMPVAGTTVFNPASRYLQYRLLYQDANPASTVAKAVRFLYQ